MRRLTRSVLPLGLALAIVALPALSGEIYTWKDAKGVTHYADSPPAGRKATTRSIGSPPVATAPAAKAVVNSDCSNARSNLVLLQGTAKLGIDTDKDGKLDREITPAERASRLKLAEAQMENYCDAPAANAATASASTARK